MTKMVECRTHGKTRPAAFVCCHLLETLRDAPAEIPDQLLVAVPPFKHDMWYAPPRIPPATRRRIDLCEARRRCPVTANVFDQPAMVKPVQRSAQ